MLHTDSNFLKVYNKIINSVLHSFSVEKKKKFKINLGCRKKTTKDIFKKCVLY